ncbi:ribbon-helix-helix protein, CopG family [uncultured Selenomonas sp.]|uniref:ribbon-helix-helix protein, CopG family n=1 Tax=uncultured Selenomonas sp. TaxID=159275 RepID=UPI0025E29FA8|nr:ribbon-helix-helix protein, CopG family [uncultured Selenomonas sp.]
MTEKLKITTKHPRGADGYKTFSIRVREETLDKINKISEETGRSRNELIGMLLDFSLKNSEVV